MNTAATAAGLDPATLGDLLRVVGSPGSGWSGAVLWNNHASDLWRYFTIYLRREIARRAGLTQKAAREQSKVSFGKVAEYQKRGAVHFHAVIRFDGPDGPDTPPPAWATLGLLDDAIRAAAARVEVVVPAVPEAGIRDGWTLRWGTQLRHPTQPRNRPRTPRRPRSARRTGGVGMKRPLPDRYLTPIDLADLLGVPIETVYQWRRKDTGPRGFRVGRHLRYDPEDVRAWVATLMDKEAA
ncbi:DNA-binding protein [Streptomyces globisporus]|uniref:DNA-binding protein n=2 Tax=Streptomyces TaxID=1883 RepID=A0A423UVZ0_STRGL|nr:DNA-binding protein [Streptomyces globisporus]